MRIYRIFFCRENEFAVDECDAHTERVQKPEKRVDIGRLVNGSQTPKVEQTKTKGFTRVRCGCVGEDPEEVGKRCEKKKGTRDAERAAAGDEAGSKVEKKERIVVKQRSTARLERSFGTATRLGCSSSQWEKGRKDSKRWQESGDRPTSMGRGRRAQGERRQRTDEQTGSGTALTEGNSDACLSSAT